MRVCLRKKKVKFSSVYSSETRAGCKEREREREREREAGGVDTADGPLKPNWEDEQGI